MMYCGPKRRDANQRRIVDALRRMGASVVITADVGGGFPDLVVGWGGETYLVEVKNRTRLSRRQRAFREKWNGGEIVVLCSVEEAKRWMSSLVQQELWENGKEVDSESNPQARSFSGAGKAGGNDDNAVCPTRAG